MTKPTQPQQVTTKQHPFDKLKQERAKKLAPVLSEEMGKNRFWYVCDRENTENFYLFDAQSKLLYSADDEHNDPFELAELLREKMSKKRFWYLNDQKGENFYAQLDTGTKILSIAFQSNFSLTSAKEKLNKNDFLGGSIFNNWELTTRDMIVNYANTPNNPRKKGSNCRLLEKDYWLCEGGRVDLDSCNPSLQSSGDGWLLTINKKFQSSSWEDFFIEIEKNKLKLISYIDTEYLNPKFQINNSWVSKSSEQIIQELYKNDWILESTESDTIISPANTIESLSDMDYRSVRLPKLDPSQFTDINKGIWEFWGMDEARLKAEGIYPRDPARDIKTYTVGIDFGTSSTVVALDKNGDHRLFRIGINDFYKPVEAEHYENPTVLEFLDLQQFRADWENKAYRPETNWDHVRCAHDAQNNFRLNSASSDIVSSIFIKMKHWAMKNGEQKQKIVDQAGYVFELPTLEQRNPIKNQLLTTEKRPFDPIEVYAWFLGMSINQRTQNEIYTKYYMTFPVDYQKEVKEKILSSFRRGLMRAMPESLAKQDVFHKTFLVEELASEPAAYAASALDTLGIKPTQKGTAYGVFDFGGGTTDFDYGYYRYATEEEEDLGYEKMIEHVDAHGDKYLGGENLLENMAYLVFQDNIDQCKHHKIPFTQPADAKAFAGSEAFLTGTAYASTNTIMLMQSLRSFWEKGELRGSDGELNTTGQVKLDLLNNLGEKANGVELIVAVDKLDAYLTARIEKGIYNFFIGAQAAFSEGMPDILYFLLAGNSSRTPWIQDFFSLNKNDKDHKANNERLKKVLRDVFKGQKLSKIIVKAPLPTDRAHPYRPNAKTGVALGLLKLAPGGQIGVVNKASVVNHGEAAFGFFVGRLRQGKLNVVLERGHAYYQWHELAPVNRGVVNLYFTQQPRALLGKMEEGDPEMTKVRIDFAGQTEGHKAFIRAIKPNEIEICSAPDKATADAGKGDNLQDVKLG